MFLCLLAHVYIFRFCNVSSSKSLDIFFEKLRTLWYQVVANPPTPLCEVLNFFHSVLCKRYLLSVMFYLRMKNNTNFLHFNVLCFFTGFLLSILQKQLWTCFQLSDCSRVCVWLFFENCLKNLVIYLQRPDFLWISNLQLHRSLEFEPNWTPYTYDYPNTLLFETQEGF